MAKNDSTGAASTADTNTTADVKKRPGGMKPIKPRTLDALTHFATLEGCPDVKEIVKFIKRFPDDYKIPGTETDSWEVGEKVNLTEAFRKEYRSLLGDALDKPVEIVEKNRGWYKVKVGKHTIRADKSDLRNA